MIDSRSLVEGLMKPEGFDNFFHDIISARDTIDPPMPRQRRGSQRLQLNADPEEYDSTSLVRIEGPELRIYFGMDGLVDVADQIIESFDEEMADTTLAVDGLRFALVFQASEVFINNKLILDNDFIGRLKYVMGRDSTSQVSYDRDAPLWPSAFESPRHDRALQYRVSRLSARVALDRVLSMPLSSALSDSVRAGGVVLRGFRERLEDESEVAIVIPDSPEDDLPLAKLTLKHMQTLDSYPLMWAALAHPAPQSALSQIALSHIGRPNTPRPGWISIEQ